MSGGAAWQRSGQTTLTKGLEREDKIDDLVLIATVNERKLQPKDGNPREWVKLECHDDEIEWKLPKLLEDGLIGWVEGVHEACAEPDVRPRVPAIGRQVVWVTSRPIADEIGRVIARHGANQRLSQLRPQRLP